jgi:c-di-GMP-binding flagellar brake protein YcgR
MTEQIEPNISIELTAIPEDTRFLVHGRLDILRILRGLAHRNEMVSAFFNGGKDLMLTSILDVNADKGTVILDYGSNEALNNRILAAEKIIFVTSLDNVKVQFVTHQIESTNFENGSAFQIRIPDQVLQLQRREYYRLTTPIINPLKCQVPMGDGSSIEMPLSDIGAGGIGIIIGSPPGVEFKPGEIVPGCRINLPGIGVLEATLRIQSTFEVTLKNGHKTLRSGCQFVDLRPAMQSLIQRYIIKLERERIANSPH